MNKERVHKLVIKPADIESKGFSLGTNNNLLLCYDCKSPLFYVKINYGVVAEEFDWGVIHNKSKRIYTLKEIGFNVYCAECGNFFENYSKYFYPEDKIVFWDFNMDELDEDERAEIQVCLNQYNQQRSFQSRYKATVFNELRCNLDKYEKDYPDVKEKQKSFKGPNNKKRKKTSKKTK